VETATLENKRAARIRERFWVDELKATLNSNKPFQYRSDYLNAKKESYCRRRESILKANAVIVRCECGVQVTKGKLTRHRRSLVHKSFSVSVR
jgi:hypothetical protein